MKIRITSVTAPSVSEPIRNITTVFEARLRTALVEKDYGGGVEQFSVFYISVDSDPTENDQYCKMHNKYGKYKDILTKKMVSYVGIAIPIDPQLILKLSVEKQSQLLAESLLKQLENPSYQFPKKFDYLRLLVDLKSLLSA